MKKLLSALLVVTMMLSFAFTVSASETATTIGSAEEFLTKISADLSGSFKLTADITLGADYTPIANFAGTLDGDGHTIDIGNRVSGRSGLFASVSGATFKNLIVKGEILFAGNAGGFVAAVSANANSTQFINCHNLVNVIVSGNYYGGGFVGNASASGVVTEFTDCNNYGAATGGTNGSVAGFVGVCLKTNFVNCANYGTVTVATASKFGGGFVGYAYGATFSGCANFANITNSASGTKIGGFVGENAKNQAITITNSINAGNTVSGIVGALNATNSKLNATGFVNVGTTTNVTCPTTAGIITVLDSYYLEGSGAGITGATAKSASELQNLEIAGFEKGDYTYPLPADLKYIPDPEDLGKDEVISISTPEQFKAIANNLTGSYILTADIALGDDYTPIANFAGILDGGNHTIDLGNRTAQGKQISGLFASVDGALIQNLSVKGNILCAGSAGGFAASVASGKTAEFINCNNYVTVAASGNSNYAGGIVGNAYNGTAVTFTNCNNYADVSAGTSVWAAGGIVGNGTNATIKNCANYGNVTVKTAGKNGGGIIGWAYGATIENCANFGDIIHSSNDTAMGGIAGAVANNRTLTVKNCVNAGAVSYGIAGAHLGTNSKTNATGFVNVGKTTNAAVPTGKGTVTVSGSYYLTGSGTGISGATEKTAEELASLSLTGFAVPSDIYNVNYPVPSALTLTTNNITVVDMGEGVITPNTQNGVLKVLYNDVVTFTVEASENAMIDSVKYNNIAVELTDGKYETAKVTADAVFEVAFINLDDIDVNDGLSFVGIYSTVQEDDEYYGENGANIAFAKAVSVNPFTVVECGLLVDTENTLSDAEFVYGAENVTKIVFNVELASDGSYGVLIYNNKATAGKTLKVRAYAKYSNGDIAYATPDQMSFGEI